MTSWSPKHFEINTYVIQVRSSCPSTQIIPVPPQRLCSTQVPSVQSSGVYEDLCSEDLQLFTFSQQIVWFLLKIYRRFNILLLPVLKHHDSFIIWKWFQPSQLGGGLHSNPAHPRLPELPQKSMSCSPCSNLAIRLTHWKLTSATFPLFTAIKKIILSDSSIIPAFGNLKQKEQKYCPKFQACLGYRARPFLKHAHTHTHLRGWGERDTKTRVMWKE